MKCTKCKGDGRELSGPSFGMCSRCRVQHADGSWHASGVEPEPIPIPVPTVESIMAAGFDKDAAAAILLWEEAKTANDGAPPAAVIAPSVKSASNILSVAVKTRIGATAKLKSGGPDMAITADLGGDELVCEWEVTDASGNKGKESHVFAVESLNIEG